MAHQASTPRVTCSLLTTDHLSNVLHHCQLLHLERIRPSRNPYSCCVMISKQHVRALAGIAGAREGGGEPGTTCGPRKHQAPAKDKQHAHPRSRFAPTSVLARTFCSSLTNKATGSELCRKRLSTCRLDCRAPQNIDRGFQWVAAGSEPAAGERERGLPAGPAAAKPFCQFCQRPPAAPDLLPCQPPATAAERPCTATGKGETHPVAS